MFQKVYVATSYTYSIYNHVSHKKEDILLGCGYEIFSNRKKALNAVQEAIIEENIYSTRLNRKYEVKKINDCKYEIITDDALCSFRTVYEVKEQKIK